MIRNFEFNPPKLVPNDSCQVILVGLLSGLENKPLAAKTASLSLPSGKDTQAMGPLCFFSLPFDSIAPLFPPSVIQPPTATAKSIITRRKIPKCPALSPVPHIRYLI